MSTNKEVYKKAKAGDGFIKLTDLAPSVDQELIDTMGEWIASKYCHLDEISQLKIGFTEYQEKQVEFLQFGLGLDFHTLMSSAIHVCIAHASDQSDQQFGVKELHLLAEYPKAVSIDRDIDVNLNKKAITLLDHYDLEDQCLECIFIGMELLFRAIFPKAHAFYLMKEKE